MGYKNYRIKTLLYNFTDLEILKDKEYVVSNSTYVDILRMQQLTDKGHEQR